MSITAEELISKLKEHSDATIQKVQNLLDKSKEESVPNAEIVELTKRLDEEKVKHEDFERRMKEMNQLHIPGMKDTVEKDEFDFGCFIQALQRMRNGQAEEAAFNAADAGYELEIIKASKQKDAYAGDGTAGGYLISDDAMQPLIKMVIARTPILSMGVKMLTGLVGSVPIPVQTGRHAGYWLGENQAVTKSDGTFADRWLRPKRLGAFAAVSNRLIYQTRGVANTIIMESLGDAMGLKLHDGILQGIGADSEPKGILNQAGMTTTPNQATTAGARFRFDKAASMVQAIDTANELGDEGSYGFIMRPEIQGGLRRERTPMFTGQAIGQGQPIAAPSVTMNNKAVEDWIGYIIRTTTQLSGTVKCGTSSYCSKVLFGNYKQLLVGMWRGLSFKTSDVASDASGNSALLKDLTYIVAMQEADCNVGRPAAFTTVSDALVREQDWTNG